MCRSPSLPARSAPSSCSTKKGATPSTTKRMLKKLASSASKLVRSSAPRTLQIKVNNVRYKGSPPKPATFLELPNNILGEIMKNLSLKNRSAVTSASKQARRELPHNMNKLKTAKNKVISYVGSMKGPTEIFTRTRKRILNRNPHRLAAFSDEAPAYNFSVILPEVDVNPFFGGPPILTLTIGSNVTDHMHIAHGYFDTIRELYIEGNEKKIAQACIDGAMGSVTFLGYGEDVLIDGLHNENANRNPAPIIMALKMGAWPNLDSLDTSVDNGIVTAFLNRQKSTTLKCVGLPASVMGKCANLKTVKFSYTSGKAIIDNIASRTYAITRLVMPFKDLDTAETREELRRKIINYMPKLKELVLTGQENKLNAFRRRSATMNLPSRVTLEVRYSGDTGYDVD